VASGDTLTKSAAPLAAVQRAASGPDWPAIDRLLATYKPAVLVVGYPYNEDGTPGALAGAADHFAAALARRAGMAVARVDERGSTQEATAELKAGAPRAPAATGWSAGMSTASRQRSSSGGGYVASTEQPPTARAGTA
jgi:putative transcription antitermination factor YqgF